MPPRMPLITASIVAVLLVGCSPSGPGSPDPSTTSQASSSTTSSATAPVGTPPPAPTWSAHQVAAIQAVEDFIGASEQIGENPSGYSAQQMKQLLEKSAGGDVVTSAVTAYSSLKERGFRYDGESVVVSTAVGEVSDVGYGLEVIVTKCIDQQNLRVVDESGQVVSEEQLGNKIPEFNLRQLTVQKRSGSDRFLVYGIASVKGSCGP